MEAGESRPHNQAPQALRLLIRAAWLQEMDEVFFAL